MSLGIFGFRVCVCSESAVFYRFWNPFMMLFNRSLFCRVVHPIIMLLLYPRWMQWKMTSFNLINVVDSLSSSSSSFVARWVRNEVVFFVLVYISTLASNEMVKLLDQIRNVFIQFWKFYSYRKWSLIEMYIFNEYHSFRKENELKPIQPSQSAIFYIWIYSNLPLLFLLYESSEALLDSLSLRFGSFMMCGFNEYVCIFVSMRIECLWWWLIRREIQQHIVTVFFFCRKYLRNESK